MGRSRETKEVVFRAVAIGASFNRTAGIGPRQALGCPVMGLVRSTVLLSGVKTLSGTVCPSMVGPHAGWSLRIYVSSFTVRKRKSFMNWPKRAPGAQAPDRSSKRLIMTSPMYI
jgi:hypothetical protein